MGFPVFLLRTSQVPPGPSVCFFLKHKLSGWIFGSIAQFGSEVPMFLSELFHRSFSSCLFFRLTSLSCYTLGSFGLFSSPFKVTRSAPAPFPVFFLPIGIPWLVQCFSRVPGFFPHPSSLMRHLPFFFSRELRFRRGDFCGFSAVHRLVCASFFSFSSLLLENHTLMVLRVLLLGPPLLEFPLISCP